MPKFTAESLRKLMKEIFLSIGCGGEEAQIAAEHLVESNLVGHDSHGVINSIWYATQIADRSIHVGQEPVLIRSQGPLALFEGNYGLGLVLGVKAVKKAIDLADEYGVGVVGVRHSSHVGRLGTYPTIAAERGMFALAMANAPCQEGMKVAPYGGTRGRMATNPMAWALPRAESYPFLLDMATSCVASGKIALYREKGERVPNGWLISPEGNYIADANAFFDSEDVALLPFGGHKGFGLSVIVEMLAGALIGHEVMYKPIAKNLADVGQGVFILVIDIKEFVEVDSFEDTAEKFFAHLKATPTKPGVEEILIPGEPEQRAKLERLQEGVPVDDETWQNIAHFAENHGLNVEKIVKEMP